MAFMSLIWIGILLLMFCVSACSFVIALILFLVNRRRRKKGTEPKKWVRVTSIIFLVIGILNAAPILLLLALNGLSTLGQNVTGYIKRREMPERAVLYYSEGDATSVPTIKYGEEEYIILEFLEPVGEPELSEEKAYLEAEGEVTDQIVYEMETDTGFDLLYVEDITGICCKKEQREEFLKCCQEGVRYLLEVYEEAPGEEAKREKEIDISLEELGITEEYRSSLSDGKGKQMADEIPNASCGLYELQMDGRFRTLCTDFVCYRGDWYCYNWDTEETQWFRGCEFDISEKGYLLPEKGQKCMKKLFPEWRE